MMKKLNALMIKVDKLQEQYDAALASNNHKAALKALTGLAEVNTELDELNR